MILAVHRLERAMGEGGRRAVGLRFRNPGIDEMPHLQFNCPGNARCSDGADAQPDDQLDMVQY